MMLFYFTKMNKEEKSAKQTEEKKTCSCHRQQAPDDSLQTVRGNNRDLWGESVGLLEIHWSHSEDISKIFTVQWMNKYRSLQTEEIGLQHHHVMRRCRFFQELNNSETVLFKMSVFFPTHVLRMEMLWCMDFFGREWISIKVQYQVYSAECSCHDRVELWRNGKTDGSHKQPWTARLTSENLLRLGESGQIQSWQHTSDWLHSLTSYLEECTEPYTKKTVTLCCFAIG